jgi:hypothetical protein
MLVGKEDISQEANSLSLKAMSSASHRNSSPSGPVEK